MRRHNVLMDEKVAALKKNPPPDYTIAHHILSATDPQTGRPLNNAQLKSEIGVVFGAVGSWVPVVSGAFGEDFGGGCSSKGNSRRSDGLLLPPTSQADRAPPQAASTHHLSDVPPANASAPRRALRRPATRSRGRWARSPPTRRCRRAWRRSSRPRGWPPRPAAPSRATLRGPTAGGCPTCWPSSASRCGCSPPPAWAPRARRTGRSRYEGGPFLGGGGVGA